MPNDSKNASNRKHKRSPSPDASNSEEPSKRRKHRHHHHRSSKHRHHSKKEKLPKIDEIENVEKIDRNRGGNRNLGDEVEKIDRNCGGNRKFGDEVEKIDRNRVGNRNLGDEVEKIDRKREKERNLGDEVGSIKEIDQNSGIDRNLGVEVENIEGIVKDSSEKERNFCDEVKNVEEIDRNLGNEVGEIGRIDQNSEKERNLGDEVENVKEIDRNLGEELAIVEEIDENSGKERNLADEVEYIEGIGKGGSEKERNLGDGVENSEGIGKDSSEKERNSGDEVGKIGEIDKNREGNRSSDEEIVNLGTVKVASGVNSLGIDYDMEEGEIIEEEDGEIIGNGDVEVLKRVSDNLHTGSLDRGVDNSRRGSVEEEDSSGKRQSNKYNGKIGAEATKISRSDRLAHPVSGENGSSFLENGKTIGHYDIERDLNVPSLYLYTEDAQRHKKSVTRSPSYYKHHTRSRSRSPSQARGRSRSQSLIRESLQGTPHRKGDRLYETVNERDTDDEGNLLDNKNFRRGSRDMLREKERGHSPSVHTRRSDRYHARDSCERSRLRSPDIDRERIKEKEMMNREREKTREKEAQRERHKDKEMEREKYRRKDKELERESDRRREREDRQRERDKERERRHRDRERSRGRSRDIHLDRTSDRGSRHPKYVDDERDKYDQSRHRRHDESDHQDKLNKSDRDITSPPEDNGKLGRLEDEPEDYEERIVLKLAEQEDDDLDRIKEESRRRKLAILEKYRSQQSQQQEAVHAELTAKDHKERPSQSVTAQNVVSEMPDAQTKGEDIFTTEPPFTIGKSPPQNGLPVIERVSGTGGLGEGTPKSERSPDMFCDDIFGESPAGVRKTDRGDGKTIERSGLNDNWDDAEGYYSYRFGELLDGRYEIVAAHGKGVFSTVVRAKDIKAKPGDPEEIAIKMIRSNETMYKAGMEELVILKKLVGADPEDRRHCVRFISSFKYRNHLCLVFESLHMNLREVLKKFGRNIGLKLTAVRTYAKQLFIALKHLRNCGVLHCDIKPDNMLVNEAKNVLKLCDFGNAMFAGKNEITPYLVSRFYRAPEIILGLPYDHPLDMWSVGCCLFELYTGKVLFPGSTNNDMLRLHMELKGPFPKKMLRKGAFIDQHFDHDLNFLASEEDPVTKKAIKRLMVNIKPKDVGSLILGSPGEDPKMLANFRDLMEKIFVLDPDKRLTVSQALSHPFITGK